MPNCSGCKNLKVKKTKEGKVAGKLYFCELHHEYRYVNEKGCDKFEKNKKITKDIIKEIEEESKKYDDSPIMVGFYLTILIILIVLGLIMGVFHF